MTVKYRIRELLTAKILPIPEEGYGKGGRRVLKYTKHYYASTSLSTGIGSERIASFLGTKQDVGLYCDSETTLIPPMDAKVLEAGDALEDVFAHFDKTFDLDTPYLYGSNSRIICAPAQITQGFGAYWYHPDHLGSSSYITNLNGEISQHMEYLPFGETLVEEHLNSNNSPYKFNAKEFDAETGNYYYGARYYDSKWSIWLSVDAKYWRYPHYSPYNYTLQNPVRFIDPSGNTPIEPARNQAGTINQAVQQWRDAGLTTIKQVMNFVTNKNIDGGAAVRYIYTNDKGWIDMQHYAGVQLYGKIAMDLLEPASGNSIMQSLFFGEGADKSYYSYEDLPSNAFSAGISLKGLEGEDLFNAILEHFDNAGATSPTDAPNYNQIPNDNQDRSRLPEKRVTEFDDLSPTRMSTRRVPDESKLKTGNYIPQNRTSQPYNLNNFDPANTSIDKIGNN